MGIRCIRVPSYNLPRPSRDSDRLNFPLIRSKISSPFNRNRKLLVHFVRRSLNSAKNSLSNSIRLIRIFLFRARVYISHYISHYILSCENSYFSLYFSLYSLVRKFLFFITVKNYKSLPQRRDDVLALGIDGRAWIMSVINESLLVSLCTCTCTCICEMFVVEPGGAAVCVVQSFLVLFILAQSLTAIPLYWARPTAA